MPLATIPTNRIELGTRLRSICEEQVAALMDSLSDVGLLNPITVYERKVMDAGIAVSGFGVVAGAHRFEAARRLGLVEIEANVVTLSELQRQLAEVDENLCGAKLTPAERSLFTRRRQEIYEALHPETKHGGAPGLAGGGKAKVDNLSGFAKDTAEKTGVDERSVRRESSRGRDIDHEALATLKGTSLDKCVELDAMTKLDRETQLDIAARAGAGEAVSARSILADRAGKRAANTAEDRDLREDAAEALAEILSECVPFARHAEMIAYLSRAKPKDVISAFHRLNGAVFDTTDAGRA